MKRIFCALTACILLGSFALAEAVPSASPVPEMLLITATPTAAPLGTVFSNEDLTVTLPLGLEILDEAAREGYDAAVQADFPGAARTVLAAAGEDKGAVVHFSVSDLEMDAAAAAREAAEKILHSTATVTDVQYGANSYSGFACAIGEQIYKLYYLKGEKGMLMIGTSGLEETQIASMLSGLVF